MPNASYRGGCLDKTFIERAYVAAVGGAAGDEVVKGLGGGGRGSGGGFRVRISSFTRTFMAGDIKRGRA